MSSLLTLTEVSAATPDRRIIFRDVSLAVGAERIGLVGRNGSGKSTLLRIAAGIDLPSSGKVLRHGREGTLAQSWPDDQIVGEALGIAEASAVLERIMAGHGNEDDFGSADWSLASRIDVALAEVGLSEIALDRPMGTLSGGERTRVGLARLALETPDLLLLDEPTNNLDAAGRQAVQALIGGWRGGVLVASHDRDLLEHMDRIVELSAIGTRIVGGGWSAFAAQRALERANASAELERHEAALRSTASAVQGAREAKDRRDKAGRAFAAKGSEPKILLSAKAERAENSGGRARKLGERQVGDARANVDAARAKVEVLTPLTIALPPTGIPSDAELLTIDAVTVIVGTRRLGPWTLTIRGPERIAVTGPNGTSKTTLLKVATGEIVPDSGTVRRAAGRIVMLDQHAALLDENETILANVRRHNPELNEEQAYAACARFAFRNQDAVRAVGAISGGERLRAGLAVTLSGTRQPWLLILDEPTNHLDIESIEILEGALKAFNGALLIVSHDRAFRDAVGLTRELHLGLMDVEMS